MPRRISAEKDRNEKATLLRSMSAVVAFPYKDDGDGDAWVAVTIARVMVRWSPSQVYFKVLERPPDNTSLWIHIDSGSRVCRSIRGVADRTGSSFSFIRDLSRVQMRRPRLPARLRRYVRIEHIAPINLANGEVSMVRHHRLGQYCM